MNIKELIELLKQYPEDYPVIIYKNSEVYSPLSDVEAMSYEKNNTWPGQVGLLELTDELRKEGYTEEDLLENGVPALILFPVD